MRQSLLSKILPIFMYGITVTYPRNQADRVSIERLNRFVARLICNNYSLPYLELLTKAGMQPVFQTVLHQRICLAQRYSKGTRYLPGGTIQPYVRNDARPHRLHAYAIVPSHPTSLQYKDAALELCLQAWNRLPNRLVLDNTASVKKRLGADSYEDPMWEICASMRAAVQLL
jgi:hypothetical protein